MSENVNAVATDTTNRTLARLVRAVRRQAEAKPRLARNAAVSLAAVSLLTAGFFAHGCVGHGTLVRPEVKEIAEVKQQDEKPKTAEVTPYQAQAKVGSPEEVSTSFVVQSTGQTDTLAFLNDQRNFKAPGVMTVVVVKTSVPGFENPRGLIGKTVTVKGHVTQYHGRPQIKVTDPKNVTLK
jgi:DNA/RNA endonuclease YhcR with UshA esterase domain